LKGFSRNLRMNTTDAERMLWSSIRCKQLEGYQFYRQRPIGNYIVDFYCPRAKVIIEIDGGQHYEDVGKFKDGVRDRFLRGMGLRVLRFSDREILENLDGVVEKIWMELQDLNPSRPSFTKEGGRISPKPSFTKGGRTKKR